MFKYAFTLLEILIVIGIVIFLSTIGIGVYGGVRQHLVLDLETDRMVNLFRSLREKSKITSNCTGVDFQNNQPLQIIYLPYTNRFSGCDENQKIKEYLHGEADLVTASILMDETTQQNFSMRFLPPLGKIIFNPLGEKMQLTVSLKKAPHIMKNITIHRETGKIEKR